jgi:hypothetical protein
MNHRCIVASNLKEICILIQLDAVHLQNMLLPVSWVLLVCLVEGGSSVTPSVSLEVRGVAEVESHSCDDEGGRAAHRSSSLLEMRLN